MEQWLMDLVDKLGYIGIFIATMVESTFVPIPAEVTVIPAGMLAAAGKINYWGALVSATAGVVVGSLLNYYIGLRFGRGLILRYGKYIFIKPEFLHKTEHFFARHGAFTVFIGRLLPGIKHYIAFVAGIAKMKLRPFLIYTSFGGLIWIWLLLQIGFMAEKQEMAGNGHITSVEMIAVAVTFITVVSWVVRSRMMKHSEAQEAKSQNEPPQGL
jgi:membrane protein DedA with SNARE-associated domain